MESIIFIFISFAVAVVAAKLIFRPIKTDSNLSKFCSNCGHQGVPILIAKGSILIEIVLWIFFLIPGLIYSIWRRTNLYQACPNCDAHNMIPLDSPVARKLISDLKEKPIVITNELEKFWSILQTINMTSFCQYKSNWETVLLVLIIRKYSENGAYGKKFSIVLFSLLIKARIKFYTFSFIWTYNEPMIKSMIGAWNIYFWRYRGSILWSHI